MMSDACDEEDLAAKNIVTVTTPTSLPVAWSRLAIEDIEELYSRLRLHNRVTIMIRMLCIALFCGTAPMIVTR